MSAHSIHPDPTCRKCGSHMMRDGIVRCAETYEIRSYVCTNCRSVFRMVEAYTSQNISVSERRAMARRDVLAIGDVEFNERILSCIVRNLSAAGAALDFKDGVKIPDDFTLVIGGSPLPGRVIWRNERRLGIAFH